MKRILILILCGLIWSAASLTAEAQTSAEDISKLSKEEKMKKFVYPLLEKWNNLPYTATSNKEYLKEYLAGIELNEGSASLTEEEREKLNEALLNLCLGFSTGVEEDYFAFRTPKGPEWGLNCDEIWLLADSLKKSLEDKEWTYENIRETALKNAVKPALYYKGFWEGICLDPKVLKEQLGEEKTAYMPRYGITVKRMERYNTFYQEYKDPYNKSIKAEDRSDINQDLLEPERYPFVLETWLVTLFSEKPMALDVFREQGYLLTADVHLMVKRGLGRPNGAVTLRFYWNPEYKVWIPHDFMKGGIDSMLVPDYGGAGVEELF